MRWTERAAERARRRLTENVAERLLAAKIVTDDQPVEVAAPAWQSPNHGIVLTTTGVRLFKH